MKSFPIVHPHRLLSCLFDYVGLQIAQSEVRQYWTHARSMGEEWALEHPASWDHIPVGIHGDAAKLWTLQIREGGGDLDERHIVQTIISQALQISLILLSSRAHGEKPYSKPRFSPVGLVFQRGF